MSRRARICACCGRATVIGIMVAGDRIHRACRDQHLLGLIRELARLVDALSVKYDTKVEA